MNATKDDSCQAKLAQHREDELEHATMPLDRMLRDMPGSDLQVKKLLFTSGGLTILAEEVKSPKSCRKGMEFGTQK